MTKEELKKLLNKEKKQTLVDLMTDLAGGNAAMEEQITRWLQQHGSGVQNSELARHQFEALVNQIMDVLDDLESSEGADYGYLK